MQIQGVPLTSATSFSKLISDYLSDNEQLKSFHNGLPSTDGLLALADKRGFSSAKREVLSTALRNQYEGLSNIGSTLENVDALKSELTFTVTTGHQLCLYSGPMFSILKIISAINICRQLTQQDPTKTFVPVFWMASEDHDLEEVNHVYLRGQKKSWNTNQTGAVGRMSASGTEDVLDELKSGFSEEFLKEIDALLHVYESGNVATSSRLFFHQIFGKHGLVIVDGDDLELKKLFVPTMLKEVEDSMALTQVGAQNQRLHELGYKAQVNAPGTFLFKITERQRIRLDRDGDRFILADGSQSWSKEELNSDLQSNPQSWSPNVVGRPLYQETILPNLGYVGGPGELAYWLQLKSLFSTAEIPFPCLILRNSATFLFPAIEKKIRTLGMNYEEIFKSEDSILSTQVQSQIPNLHEERKELQLVYQKLAMKLSQLDSGLSKSTETEGSKALKGVENLEAKAVRAAKRKNEELVMKVSAIKKAIKPDGIPQERQLNILEVMSIFGTDVIDDLIPVLDPFEENMWIVTL